MTSPIARSAEVRDHVRRQFTSAAHGWVWALPAQVSRWIDRELDHVEAALRSEGR